jgi:Rha family phage regulatory protein
MKIVTKTINGQDVQAVSLFDIQQALGLTMTLQAQDQFFSLPEVVEYLIGKGRSDLAASLQPTTSVILVEPEPEFTPTLTVHDGKVFANSREVAEVFGKEHKNVLRDISTLCADDPQWGQLNFEQTPYVDSQNGQTYKSFNMNRDGLTLLVMGFTGDKARKFKKAYMTAFNRMEAELAKRPALDLTNPNNLLPLLAQYAEDKKRLTEQVAVLEPKALVHDRIVAEEDDMALSHGAKILHIPQQRFFQILSEELGWIFKRPSSKVWLPYANLLALGFLKLKEVEDETGRMRRQTVLTPLGLSALARMSCFPVMQ